MTFQIGVAVDHDEVIGACISCHFDGNSFGAPSQPGDHMATSDDCAACHTTSSFSTGINVDHNEVIGACESCHFSGNTWGAPTKYVGHMATTDDCAACHGSTADFSASIDVDMGETIGACETCHFVGNTWGAPTKYVGHMNTTDDCAACHGSTTDWADSIDVDMGETIGACESCHYVANPWGAPTKIVNHMPASETCDNCHTSTDTFSRPFIDTVNSGEMVTPCDTCHFAGNTWGAPFPIP